MDLSTNEWKGGAHLQESDRPALESDLYSDEIVCPCMFPDDYASETCNRNNGHFEVLSRIGTESSAAEVFRVRMVDMGGHVLEVAAKVMPATAENATEIEFAQEMGEEEGFLPILGVSFCAEARFHAQSKFSGFSGDGVTVLFSKLAWGDLVFLSKAKIFEADQWIDLLEQVVWGIDTLQEHNILHGDLHMANVLVNLEGDELIDTWIHDFGRSERIEDWNIKNRIADLVMFFKSLSKVSGFLPDAVQDLLEELLDHTLNIRNPEVNFFTEFTDLFSQARENFE